jgi:hypothetical protein
MIPGEREGGRPMTTTANDNEADERIAALIESYTDKAGWRTG